MIVTLAQLGYDPKFSEGVYLLEESLGRAGISLDWSREADGDYPDLMAVCRKCGTIWEFNALGRPAVCCPRGCNCLDLD